MDDHTSAPEAPRDSSLDPAKPKDFIRDIIEADLRSSKHQQVVTRFPPEPNGYPHIGHAKAVSVNFGIAQEYPGRCHLRFDDTNPVKEETEYVEAIERDIKWLGYDWGEHLYFASDYFEQLYQLAEGLIEKGLAYVDDLTAEEIREYRGTLKEPGKNSPHRGRSPEESLDLFRRMRAGEFPEGSRVLRAKIDMASPNINMRDPVLYRILHTHHHRTSDDWNIYPMYDYTHPLSDAIEGITHSLCSLEFEDHRPLYDWVVEHAAVPHRPRQIEFARLNLTYTVTSKRTLRQLVEQGKVNGWDDPRMPTLSGMRRRGYHPEGIRNFLGAIGLAKANSEVEYGYLEHFQREVWNREAPRVMAVLDPLKVTITNYPEGQTEEVEAINNPEDESAGTRMMPFSRVVYIEREDFMEDPPKKFFRLAPGREIRLKHAYFIRCDEVVKDAEGNVVELLCSYDPESRGGSTPDGRKVKGTSHWVSAEHAIDAEVRLYGHLFTVPRPGATTGSAIDDVDPESLTLLNGVKVEAGLADASVGAVFQFLRQGYFAVDPESGPGKLVFNRTVTLKDTWAKVATKEGMQ
ncbi:MAG: glutamine--tRNA ligase/YqeY domain fusion protein [Candidatus Eisenbacteria bacterium]|uniref:Glutamine--tRNA ligase n=1 Tax=Eiseniibacteriota bacterium TaxID=2212470 RepID=A0A956SBA3_UNCEI|nr:glutamine--tRNA ligase/YqeY domain fusion protein [Candidatus Eisenbacteria bacterium]MCB9463001.1 glutamine--tRNA ligase/YqeY domain fusion protein [Candidatus Eisenbacteria bacterium]